MAQRYNEPVELVVDEDYMHEQAEAFCVFACLGASLPDNEPYPHDTIESACEELAELAESWYGEDTFAVAVAWLDDDATIPTAYLAYPYEGAMGAYNIYIGDCDPADFAEA